MTCENALRDLLDAEPEAYSGTGDGELAEHLRSCSRCSRVAAHLRKEERILAEALGSNAVEPEADVVRSIVGRAHAAGEFGRPEVVAARSLVARRWAHWVPALAAAALVAVALWPSAPASVSDPSIALKPQTPPPPRIHAPPGTDVAVLATSDPSITVVWILGGVKK